MQIGDNFTCSCPERFYGDDCSLDRCNRDAAEACYVSLLVDIATNPFDNDTICLYVEL